jgi:hypothetical protein
MMSYMNERTILLTKSYQIPTRMKLHNILRKKYNSGIPKKMGSNPEWGRTLNSEFEGFDRIKPKTININVTAQQITGADPNSRAAQFNRSVNRKMKYKDLSHEDFDAIVTGELTHYALWFEGEIINIITDYFLGSSPKRSDFKRILLLRDGLTFQDKIEIVRAMIPLFDQNAITANLKLLLKQVEEFKSWRNALAHGADVSDNDTKAELKVEVVSRSGKEQVVHITPEFHETKMAEAEKLLLDLTAFRKTLR